MSFQRHLERHERALDEFSNKFELFIGSLIKWKEDMKDSAVYIRDAWEYTRQNADDELIDVVDELSKEQNRLKTMKTLIDSVMDAVCFDFREPVGSNANQNPENVESCSTNNESIAQKSEVILENGACETVNDSLMEVDKLEDNLLETTNSNAPLQTTPCEDQEDDFTIIDGDFDAQQMEQEGKLKGIQRRVQSENATITGHKGLAESENQVHERNEDVN